MYSNKRIEATVSILGTDGWQMVDGEIIMLDEAVTAPTEEELQTEISKIEAMEKLSAMTKLLENYIHAEVEKYNLENGLQFGSIHNVANYMNTPTYTHHNWCSQVWNWNVEIWETSRAIQAQVVAGERPIPTQEEFIAELPVFELVEVDLPPAEEPVEEV